MALLTERGWTAAFVVTVVAFSGVVVGSIIPNVVRTRHVEYGSWPSGTNMTAVMCVEGAVHITDGAARSLGKLPTVTDNGGPYCTYRACYTPAQAPAKGQTPALPDPSMDPLFADVEVPWQSPWPPLAVWCNDGGTDDPTACACTPQVPGTCQKRDRVTGNLVAASWGDTMTAGNWAGSCTRMPCTRLAGKSDNWLPAGCCKPNCINKTCGGDGCGGSCGTCGSQLGPDNVTPVQLVCDAGAGRCCASPPCTPSRTPFHPEWPLP